MDTSLPHERHVLIIDGLSHRHAIALEAAAYSVGRDLTNAIVLDFETVSRQHAIFLRVPIPGTNQYHYRLIDGNADGKPSTNGTFINGKRCTGQPLNHGDIILFGRKIKAAYLKVSMDEHEFVNYLESISFQSIKSQSLNPKATLAGHEFSGELMATQLNQLTREVESPVSQPLPEREAPVVTPPAPLPEPLPEVVVPESVAPLYPELHQPPTSNKETIPETVHPPRRAWKTTVMGLVAILAVAGTGVIVLHQGNSNGPNLPNTTPQNR